MRCWAVVLLCAWSGLVAAQDMPLSQVLLDHEGWQLVAEGYKSAESPTADAAGNVFFVDVAASRIHKIGVDGQISVFAEQTGNASGLMFGPEGRLYVCQMGKSRVGWYDTNSEWHVIAKGIPGNSLTVDRTGGMFVTDLSGKTIWYVSPQGEKRIVHEGFGANGLTLWGDAGTLVVGDWDEPHLRTFRVGKGGDLLFGDKYYGPLQVPFGESKPGSAGMTMDDDGRLYVCTYSGLQMFDPTGRLGGAIAKPQDKFMGSVTFGGSNFDTLYVTCTDKVYKRKTKVRGTPFFLGPVKKNAP